MKKLMIVVLAAAMCAVAQADEAVAVPVPIGDLPSGSVVATTLRADGSTSRAAQRRQPFKQT